MALMGLLMACYGGLWGIPTGHTKSTDHPSRGPQYHINGRILQYVISGIPYIGPWNQNVRRLRFCGLFGPYERKA